MRDKLLDVTSNEHLLQKKISIKSTLKNSLDLKKRQHMINAENHNSRKPTHDQNLKKTSSGAITGESKEGNNDQGKNFLKPILTNLNEEHKRPTSSAKSKKIQFNENLSSNKHHLLRATSTNVIRLNGKNLKTNVNKLRLK
jgi:hypothetical protein